MGGIATWTFLPSLGLTLRRNALMPQDATPRPMPTGVMPLPMRRLPLAVVMCAALKAMIVANEFLELEVCELKQAVSHAFVRGRFKTYTG